MGRGACYRNNVLYVTVRVMFSSVVGGGACYRNNVLYVTVRVIFSSVVGGGARCRNNVSCERMTEGDYKMR